MISFKIVKVQTVFKDSPRIPTTAFKFICNLHYDTKVNVHKRLIVMNYRFRKHFLFASYHWGTHFACICFKSGIQRYRQNVYLPHGAFNASSSLAYLLPLIMPLSKNFTNSILRNLYISMPLVV